MMEYFPAQHRHQYTDSLSSDKRNLPQFLRRIEYPSPQYETHGLRTYKKTNLAYEVTD
jgi:hypothetical protein